MFGCLGTEGGTGPEYKVLKLEIDTSADHPHENLMPLIPSGDFSTEIYDPTYVTTSYIINAVPIKDTNEEYNFNAANQNKVNISQRISISKD